MFYGKIKDNRVYSVIDKNENKFDLMKNIMNYKVDIYLKKKDKALIFFVSFNIDIYDNYFLFDKRLKSIAKIKNKCYYLCIR